MSDQGHAPVTAHGDAQAAEGHGSSRKSYMVVFGLLFLFTVLEVAVASPRLGISQGPMVVSLVTLALTKAAMVGYFFMHLKSEMKALRWTVMTPFAFPALYAFVLIAEAAWRLIR